MTRKKIPAFDLTKSPYRDTTLARQVSKQNLTLLNNAFWVSERSFPLVESAFSSLTFPTDLKAHGKFGSEDQWVAAVGEQRQWIRQHILLSAAALLEVYLSTAIAAALWARPEYADRSLSGISAVQIIKFPERAPGLRKLIVDNSETMLKGEWSSRLRRLAVIFGKLPARLETLAPQLQTLQGQRNRIAHHFGQKSKDVRRTPWAPMDSITLSVSEVEKSLVLVSDTIREADLRLFGPLIGGYELLYEFHSWLAAQTDPFKRPAPDLVEPEFRRHIRTKFGSGPDKEYYLALIRYYDSCA